MLKWLFRKKTQAASVGPAAPDDRVADDDPVATSAEPVTAADLKMLSATPPPPEPVQPAREAWSGSDGKERPEVGMLAAVLSRTTAIEAEIVRIQAGGRRVIARPKNKGAQAYTRRSDGSYWLEGAPAYVSRRLVIESPLS